MASLPLISIVDDDHSVRESLQRLVRSVGFAVQIFASGETFLKSESLKHTSCLILDVRIPGMNGQEIQGKLRDAHYDIPIIFITAHRNEKARLQALADGAVDYLFKPFRDQALLSAIEAALRLKVVATR